MTKKKSMTVGLLSHYQQDPNLGCVALAVSNMRLMDDAAASLGIELTYRLLVNEKQAQAAPVFSRAPYEYRTFPSSKGTLRRPWSLLQTNALEGCDLVVNINAGDGFTDLYGRARMLSESYMLLLAQRKGIPTVMAPQTIGPFASRLARVVGKKVMRNSIAVFSRDRLSTALVDDLCGAPTAREVIDVAFALPYQAESLEPLANGKSRVGINVSGLLYRGGYDRSNYFNLAVDYRDFIHRLVSRSRDQGHEVHLIGHVVANEGDIEDDYSACADVSREFPGTVLAPRFGDPVAVKNYIAQMDFFSGARMHSTIAAFSAGVPVVPIGYSKKLNGLYDTLGYPYYVDLRDDRLDAEGASDQVVEWLGERAVLKEGVAAGQQIARNRLDEYTTHLTQILESRI